MATKLEAARLLTRDAAERKQAGERADVEAGMAKLFASETAFEIVDEAMRIHGGVGYTTELPIERYYRDAPLMLDRRGHQRDPAARDRPRPARPRNALDEPRRSTPTSVRFGRYFEDFEVGDVYKHWPGKTITEADDHLFCMITMNHHPLHTDAWYAETQTQFGKNVVVGNLVYSLVLGMTVPDVSGVAIANLEVETLQHKKPTFHGDTIYAETTVLEKNESQSKPDRGIVDVETVGFNQRGERSATSAARCWCRSGPPGSGRGRDPAVPRRRTPGHPGDRERRRRGLPRRHPRRPLARALHGCRRARRGDRRRRRLLSGYEADGELIGVMGIQAVGDVDLIRHAYVLPGRQRAGVGGALLRHLCEAADRAEAASAHGPRPAGPSASTSTPRASSWSAERKTELLRTYWSIPERQIEIVGRAGRPAGSTPADPLHSDLGRDCRAPAAWTPARRSRWPGLAKRYGSHVAVDGVSLTVDGGEVCSACLGPNGAGEDDDPRR